MNAIVAFLGPSAPSRIDPTIDVRPPAAAGDLLALIVEEPCTVVLLDGVFDARAAVRHKEILALLARGFRVIGAASMGALRAAELDGLGMEGVGRVYEAYRRERITGDDEVALLHVPASMGSHAVTVPLVDVRATIGFALRTRRIGRTTARCMFEAARALHFTERDWPAIFERMAGAGYIVEPTLPPWIDENRVWVKRDDASAALAAAVSRQRPPHPSIHCHATAYVRQLARQVGVELPSFPIS